MFHHSAPSMPVSLGVSGFDDAIQLRLRQEQSRSFQKASHRRDSVSASLFGGYRSRNKGDGCSSHDEIFTLVTGTKELYDEISRRCHWGCYRSSGPHLNGSARCPCSDSYGNTGRAASSSGTPLHVRKRRFECSGPLIRQKESLLISYCPPSRNIGTATTGSLAVTIFSTSSIFVSISAFPTDFASTSKKMHVDSTAFECFICPPGGTCMAYEWDYRRARRVRLLKMASALALTASALSVPVAMLLVAAPL